MNMPHNVEKLASSIYAGYPAGVQEAAAGSIKQHLDKLVHDKKIVLDDDTSQYTLIGNVHL